MILPRLIIPTAVLILAASPGFANPAAPILDNNGNGVSDIWELDINHGSLLPANYQKAVDDDGDGQTNGAEAIAGTQPDNPQPPDGLFSHETLDVPAVYETIGGTTTEKSPRRLVVSWTGKIGKTYTLLHSLDLATWTPGQTRLCDGTPMDGGVYIVPAVASQFLRLAIADIDRDGDGLNDYEEHLRSTDPTNKDSDGDGMEDKAELEWINPADGTRPLSPLNPDYDLDGIKDGAEVTLHHTNPAINNAEASPDTAGLISATTGQATALLTSMIGRWDFETLETAAPQTGYPLFRFHDATAGARHASPFLITATYPEGMISKAARTLPATGTSTGFIAIPPSLLNNRSYYTVSFWAALEKNSVAGYPNSQAVGLFGHHSYKSYLSNGTTGYALIDIAANGIWIENTGTRQHLHAGTYTYINHNGNLLITPVVTRLGVDLDRPQGTFDDGRWHHYVLVRNNALTVLYIDGALAGEAIHNVTTILPDIDAGVSLARLYGPAPSAVPVQPPNQPAAKGRFDRLRVWPSVLDATDAATLYHEDADHDGLWDVTEAASSLWRDTNSDAIRTPDEVAFYINPMRYDPPGKDHDRDGITSINEQTLGTGIYDADSDDDGIPDGYDQAHCLGPLVKDLVLSADADGDGLTLAAELAYGTNPNAPDSDGDGTSDGIEAGQNGLPNDDADQGQPPAPAAVLSLRLAVGDESGSDSEDYHLVVYRYDPETHAETEVYRLRSGGFGQYSGDRVVSCFRQDEQYTVRIQWQGSRLTSRSASPGVTAEGPDFDYTLKVEPAESYPGLVIEDAIKPATDDSYPGRTLLGVMGDVTDFPVVSYEGAVKLTKTYIDLAVDCNTDGRIDSLPDDSSKALTFGYAGAAMPAPALPLDRTYENADPPRAVVIDVNNDNDNGDGVVDYDNDQIDSATDRNQLDGGFARGASTPGHTLGKLRVEAYPLDHIVDGTLALRLSFPNPADANLVRVFDWQSNGQGYGDKPVALLGPGSPAKTTVVLDKATFITGLSNEAGRSYRDLVMEGLTYGTATLKLELFDVATNNVISTDEVKVTANVDQYILDTGDHAANPEAWPLRGVAPHRAGIQLLPAGGTAGYLRAIKGTITCRVPSFKDKSSNPTFHTHLTPLHGKPLRPHSIEDKSSGQSFWVGLQQNLAGGDMTWAQCGLRWEQDAGRPESTKPMAYLETGTRLNGVVCPNLRTIGPGSNTGQASGLLDWPTQLLVLDFVMWKEVGTTVGENGPDSSFIPWRVIFKDSRTGKSAGDLSNYIDLDCTVPKPKPRYIPNVTERYESTYKAQKMNVLGAQMECNNSVSFAMGTEGQKAGVANLAGASVMANGASTSPPSGNLVVCWNWAQTAFAWEAVTVPQNKVGLEIRTGRNAGGSAEIGSAAHPFWHVAPVGNGFQLWDDRSYGFGQQDIKP